jgi:hypothetical protein
MRNNIAREKMEVSIMGEREYAIICTFVKKNFCGKYSPGGAVKRGRMEGRSFQDCGAGCARRIRAMVAT